MFRAITQSSFVNEKTVNRNETLVGDSYGELFWMSKDGTFINDNNNDNNQYIINGFVGGTVATVATPNGVTYSSWSPNSSKVAFCEPFWRNPSTFEGRVRIFDSTGTFVSTISNPRTNFNDFFGQFASWSANGNVIAVGSNSYSNLPTNTNIFARVHIFNANSGALITTILDPQGATTGASFTDFGTRVWLNYDGTQAIVAARRANGLRGRIYVFNSVNGSLIRTIESPLNEAREFSFQCWASDDGSRILAGERVASAFGATKAYLINSATGAVITTYDDPVVPAYNDYWGYVCNISADGSRIAIARKLNGNTYAPWEIYIYRLDSPTIEKIVQAPKSQTEQLMNVYLSADGSRLYASQSDSFDFSGNGGVRIYAI